MTIFAGRLTTDGGGLLLRQADPKIELLKRVVPCFTGARDPERIEHGLGELLAQRIYGLAPGYQDLNDHEELRNDALLGVLAGKSTLNRLELTPSGAPHTERYHKITYSVEAIDALLVDIFLEAHAKPPQQIVLDLGASDGPLHGRQEAWFFHGYYKHYCYLPWYIFSGDHVLRARPRPSDIDGSAGSVEEVARIVRRIRRRWPRVQILLRADSGFYREELMARCEKHRVDYGLGLARNERLRRIIGAPCTRPNRNSDGRGKPRGRSRSSSIGRGRVAAGGGAWWPSASRSKGRKIRATW